MLKIDPLIIKRLKNQKHIRNLAIIAHVDHGKSTLTDCLLTASGMISKQVGAQDPYTDFNEDERARGITIDAAAVSFRYFDYDESEYLINLIDTPGHVDFGGRVTEAIRACDGAILLVDSVEGIKSQTERILEQAIKEGIELVLFINKVDKLIIKANYDLNVIIDKIKTIVKEVNQLIQIYEEEHLNYFSNQKKNIIVGSALYRWGVSPTSAEFTGYNLTKIVELIKNQDPEINIKSELSQSILSVVIKNIPSPKGLQAKKLSRIWTDNEYFKEVALCKSEGSALVNITFADFDDQLGSFCYGRVISGTLKKGDHVFILPNNDKYRISKLSLVLGKTRVEVDELPAGTIGMIQGLKEANIGDTISTDPLIPPFNRIVHQVEPMFRLAIRPKDLSETEKLAKITSKFLKSYSTTVNFEFHEETGEFILAGIGILQLEVIMDRITNKYGIKLDSKLPTVIYRETIFEESSEVMEKTKNGHNFFKIKVIPLAEEAKLLLEKWDKEGKYKFANRKDEFLAHVEPERREEFKKYVNRLIGVNRSNLFVNATSGVQRIDELRETMNRGVIKALEKGPLTKSKVVGVCVVLTDAEIHEDPRHRQDSQVTPCFRHLLNQALGEAEIKILEPINSLTVTCPFEIHDLCQKLIIQRRGLSDREIYLTDKIRMMGKAPAAELLDFEDKLLSETKGRATFSCSFKCYEKLPESLAKKVIEDLSKDI